MPLVSSGRTLSGLSELVELTADGLVILDADLRCLHANRAARELLADPTDELTGQEFALRFPHHERQSIVDHLSQSDTDETGSWSSVLRSPEGDERAIECTPQFPIIDGQRVVAITVRDQTERRQLRRKTVALTKIAAVAVKSAQLAAEAQTKAAEAERRQADERYRSIFEAAAIGTAITDLEGRLLETNRALQELLGWSADELRGVSFPEFTHQDDVQRQLPMFAELVAGKCEYYQIEKRYIRKDGAEVWGRLTESLGRDKDGKPAFTIAMVEDITERVQAYELLEQRVAERTRELTRLYERAQEVAALEERQRLARELHDSVSQALYGIALGARTARTLLDREPTQLAEPLDFVLQQAEAALTEMRALIFELRPEALETEGLIAALEKQVAAVRARHGIDVSADLGTEPEAAFEAKEAVYRIAQEALHNTVKHARARKVELRLEWNGRGIILEIADDGTGFDAAASYPGHLGLRTMHERATQVGGTLHIDSTPGRGTEIKVEVPMV